MQKIIDKLLILAKKALITNDIPVSAIILDKNNQIISFAKNEKEKLKDPTAHAEILAIRKACQKLNTWYLKDYKIITTLEPCPMCFHAILESRLSKVIYLAKDFKNGMINADINFCDLKTLKNKPEFKFLENENAKILIKNFFQKLREK